MSKATVTGCLLTLFAILVFAPGARADFDPCGEHCYENVCGHLHYKDPSAYIFCQIQCVCKCKHGEHAFECIQSRMMNVSAAPNNCLEALRQSLGNCGTPKGNNDSSHRKCVQSAVGNYMSCKEGQSLVQ